VIYPSYLYQRVCFSTVCDWPSDRGAAQGVFGRATYYLTPTAWIAADGRYEQYGFGTQPVLTTQQRFGLEAFYQFPWQRHDLTLRGRFEYATLEEPGVASERAVNFQLSTRWRF